MKPCVICGEPKRSGHPKWCPDHWLLKQARDVQEAAAVVARNAMEARANGETIKRPPKDSWPVGRTWCHGCYRFRVSEAFRPGATQCRTCTSMKSHASQVQRTYGLLPGEYELLLEAQNGRCYICGRKSPSRRLAVDHAHDTEEVRGLLCPDPERGCNKAVLANIEFLPDPVAVAQRIVVYLTEPPARAVLAKARER